MRNEDERTDPGGGWTPCLPREPAPGRGLSPRAASARWPGPARSRRCILGLGEAFAERLAADGHDLIVVARRKDRLRALADRLAAAHRAATEILVADLTNPDDLRQVKAQIAAGPSLELLVNDAGFGGFRPFLQQDPGRGADRPAGAGGDPAGPRGAAGDGGARPGRAGQRVLAACLQRQPALAAAAAGPRRRRRHQGLRQRRHPAAAG